jgi:hypothetical protein
MTKNTAKEAPHEEIEDDIDETQTPEADAVSETPEVIPSWFSRTYGEKSPNEMAQVYNQTRQPPAPPVRVEGTAAYEAYRKRLEERMADAQRLTDSNSASYGVIPTSHETLFPNRPRFARPLPGQAQPAPRFKKPLGLHPSVLALTLLAACVVGSGLGYVVANPGESKLFAFQSASLMTSLWSAPVVAQTETVIAKKPVRSAKIEVKDTSGAINAPIPLDISALPGDADTPVAFRITGLPPSAYLTKGYEISKGEWMLKAGDVANAELIVPHTTTPELALQVSALEEKTGAPAAPSQTFTVTLDTTAVPVPGVPQPKTDGPVITPVAAQPNQNFNKLDMPAAVPMPLESVNPDVQNLVVKGDMLLDNGDLLAARQFYLRAFQLKATSAAYGVGQTYDPAVYAKHKITGISPDIQVAAEWYGKAAAGGSELASKALAELPVEP